MKNNIKVAREQKGLTQQECVDIFGVKLRAWQTYEQGVSEPKYELLCKIADTFGVTTDYLLGREEQLSPIFTDNDAELEELMLEAYRDLPEEYRKRFLDEIRKKVITQEQGSETSLELISDIGKRKRHSMRTGDIVTDEQAKAKEAT